jgi:uncharacterized protein with HEPN domain
LRRDDQWLADIVQAAEAIGRFIEGLDLEAFIASDKDQSAVLVKLIVIGEAAGKLSAELKGRYADIPWRSITGLRHFGVHEYFRIEWDRLWITATADVPRLLIQVRPILEAHRPGDA